MTPWELSNLRFEGHCPPFARGSPNGTPWKWCLETPHWFQRKERRFQEQKEDVEQAIFCCQRASKGVCIIYTYIIYTYITYTYIQIYCTENILMAFMGIEAKSWKVFFQHWHLFHPCLMSTGLWGYWQTVLNQFLGACFPPPPCWSSQAFKKPRCCECWKWAGLVLANRS